VTRLDVDAGTKTPVRILPDTDMLKLPPTPMAEAEDVWLFPERTYECEVRLVAEEGGGYSVYVPELPGVVSEGDTYDTAIDNVTEALGASLRVYHEADQAIPWDKTDKPLEPNERRAWVTVDV